MNRLFSRLAISLITAYCLLITISPPPAHATSTSEAGVVGAITYGLSKQFVTIDQNVKDITDEAILESLEPTPTNLTKYIGGEISVNNGVAYSPGILGAQGQIVALLYQNQPSSREYIADILDNIGIPQVSSAYAQGTGYSAMSPFLEFWKSFRNLAYSLYIIMFVVVGVMIMLRTKINAQTVITVQAALPNLVITLLLITFSYAIVGFMIDLMYFFIYALVYLLSAADIIATPTQTISRLLGYSAWSVVFEGRNSIISAVAQAIDEVLSGLGTGGIGAIGKIMSMVNFAYLLVAVWFAISMLKLMFVLIKSYVMIIVQTVTAPIQLLMNAMPGSQAFSTWLKKTASYLIPFPVAAAMFIMAAVFIGDPTKSTLANDIWPGNANPFGINQNHDVYQDQDSMWLPPFTLTGSANLASSDIMIIIGAFIFTMTPAVTKMAQEWLQVKESPYTAEAFAGAGVAFGLGKSAQGWKTSLRHQREAQQQMDYQKSMAAGIKDLKPK